MREASNGRTVTDTDSCAFLVLTNHYRQREDDRGFSNIIMKPNFTPISQLPKQQISPKSPKFLLIWGALLALVAWVIVDLTPWIPMYEGRHATIDQALDIISNLYSMGASSPFLIYMMLGSRIVAIAAVVALCAVFVRLRFLAILAYIITALIQLALCITIFVNVLSGSSGLIPVLCILLCMIASVVLIAIGTVRMFKNQTHETANGSNSNFWITPLVGFIPVVSTLWFMMTNKNIIANKKDAKSFQVMRIIAFLPLIFLIPNVSVLRLGMVLCAGAIVLFYYFMWKECDAPVEGKRSFIITAVVVIIGTLIAIFYGTVYTFGRFIPSAALTYSAAAYAIPGIIACIFAKSLCDSLSKK